MTPWPEARYKKLIADLIAWAELPDSTIIQGFCKKYKIHYDTLKYHVRHYQPLSDAFHVAKNTLYNRRRSVLKESRKRKPLRGLFPKSLYKEEPEEETDLSTELGRDTAETYCLIEEIQMSILHYTLEVDRVASESQDEHDRLVLRAYERRLVHLLNDVMMDPEFRHASFCDSAYWDSFIRERMKQKS